MSEKQRLKNRLKYAMSAALAGRYEEAQHILDSVRVDADATLLGHETSIGLPRRLHSAFLRLAKAQHDVIRKTGYQFHLVPPVDVLNKYARFSIAERKRITQANRLAVPQKIHQIWIGEKTPPVTTAVWREHAEKHGYEYQLWQEDKLQELNLADNATFCDMLKKGDRPGAVDVARYTILQKFGGIYLDCDWYPARDDISFHDLLPMTGLTAMPEDIPRNTGKGCTLLANSFIAAPPRHPIFTRLIQYLTTSTKSYPKPLHGGQPAP
jgi:mannosyltransferase OCH1-like enzyme